MMAYLYTVSCCDPISVYTKAVKSNSACLGIIILTIIRHELYFLNGTEAQALRLWLIMPNFGASLRIVFGPS